MRYANVNRLSEVNCDRLRATVDAARNRPPPSVGKVGLFRYEIEAAYALNDRKGFDPSQSSTVVLQEKLDAREQAGFEQGRKSAYLQIAAAAQQLAESPSAQEPRSRARKSVEHA
jgi:hypothetical protein